MKIRCAECGAESEREARGWRAYLAGGLEGEDDEGASADLFCPDCSRREFE